jgi:hypothetical protein
MFINKLKLTVTNPLLLAGNPIGHFFQETHPSK